MRLGRLSVRGRGKPACFFPSGAYPETERAKAASLSGKAALRSLPNQPAESKKFHKKDENMIEQFFDFSPELLKADQKALELCRERFAQLERTDRKSVV